MYSFEGNFRRKSEQSLRGASKKLNREELLQRAAQERRQREDCRRKIKAATVIQCHVRSYLVRKEINRQLRLEFDGVLNQCSGAVNVSLGDIGSLAHWLLIFYSNQQDSTRLISFGQLVLKNKDQVIASLVSDTSQWLHRIKKLIHLNMRHLSVTVTCDQQQAGIAIPLRLIEVFTGVATYSSHFSPSDAQHLVASIWNFLVRHGYFTQLRKVLDFKVPEPYEESSRAPTPLATSLLDLALRPLATYSQNSDKNVVCFIIHRFFGQLLVGPFSAQVRYFVIPSITGDIPENLSATLVLNALLNEKKASEMNDESSSSLCLSLPPSIWLFFSVVKLVAPQLTKLSATQRAKYLILLRLLSEALREVSQSKAFADEDSEREEAEAMEVFAEDSPNAFKDPLKVMTQVLDIINCPEHVTSIASLTEAEDSDSEAIVSMSQLCYSMLSCNRLAVNKFRLLYTLAFNGRFLRLLWTYVTRVSTPSVFGSPTSLLQVLSRGLPLAAVEWHHILPQLTLFCALISYLLPTVDDVEFYESTEEDKDLKFSSMPFTLRELEAMTLILRDVCIGLIELAYHDTKLAVKEEYKKAMKSVRNENSEELTDVKVWLKLFKASVYLLRQLHARDSRRAFCPPGHWISKQISIPVERPTNFRVGIRQRQRYQQFIGLRRLTREELEVDGPPLSTSEVRNITILQEIPFVVPFHDRVKIFQVLMAKDKEEHRGNAHHFMVAGSTIDVLVRRNYIYEDAFDKLSPENEPDLKKPVRVQLVNAVGLDEAGIDGGGIFREFLNELLKTAFDPNRGFFKCTHDRLLFPNPAANIILENYQNHYHFIGRILGKAFYENMLVELPFASFFLAKLLAKHTENVDIHNLATLDPLIYKNLVFLKNYEGDVSDLGLDFTVVNSDLGENQIVELKPGGASIPVTASNRIEYIHLMADYRLNKQIRSHCGAFKQGLANVIDLDWIRMFDPRELQILISGAPNPIDIEDLKQHTNYSGGYSGSHPTIDAFWKAVAELTDNQRRKLLKFVTSCSRPPLLGFKDLNPPFCIQFAGKEDRLPTASTCMNLLKLPEFNDHTVLKQKLLYAIESGVGFELS